MMAGSLPSQEEQLTLSELLETGFLHCALCKQVYKDPRLLPCLHTFCRECIEEIQKVEVQSTEENVTDQSDLRDDNKSDQSETRNCNNDQSIQMSPRDNHSICDEDGEDNNNNAKAADTKKAVTKRIRTVTLICPACKATTQQIVTAKCSFPVNTFTKGLCEMYEYKHEQEKSCDYCSYDGKQNNANSLCLDCHDNMCQSCTSAHRRTKVTREHKVIPYNQVQKGLYDSDIREYQHQTCSHHNDQPLDMFCEKCELLMCKQCKVQHHDDHRWTSAETAVTKYATVMKNLLAGIQSQIPSVVNYIQFLSNYNQSIVGGRDKQVAKIEEQSQLLHKFIDEQKASYIQAINKECDKERCELQVKSTNLKIAAGSLQNNEQFLRTLLEYGKPDEILSLHHVITQRLTQFRNMRMDGVNTKLRMDFTSGNSSVKNIRTVFGKLSIDHMPLNKGSEGLASQNALQITSILPNVNNTAELLREFDADGQGDGKEVWPTGVGVTSDGEIIVVDRDNKKVKVFNNQGSLKIEIKGSGDNKIGSPFDVAVLKSGSIAVTDHETEDVKIFTTDGEFKVAIKDGIKYPRGITVNSKGEIIILDCQSLQLTVHNPDSGERIRTIEGRDANGRKVLVDPYYVSVTEQDNIIITDTAAPNIKVFSPTGNYLANYGQYGLGEDEILQPYGVCCDSYGYIFVADNINHRVHLLLPDGKFSKFLVTKTEGLWHPMGLAISELGYLVVTEALGKVKVFKYI